MYLDEGFKIENIKDAIFSNVHLAFLSALSFSFRALIASLLMQILDFRRKIVFGKLFGWLQTSFALGISISRYSGSPNPESI